MGSIRNFFSMSRHDRMGALLVMALLALALLGLLAVKSCWREVLPSAVDLDRVKFEQLVDSAAAAAVMQAQAARSKKNPHVKHSRGSHRKGKAKKGRGTLEKQHAERDLEEIPNF